MATLGLSLSSIGTTALTLNLIKLQESGVDISSLQAAIHHSPQDLILAGCSLGCTLFGLNFCHSADESFKHAIQSKVDSIADTFS